jgi:hypothetical protein
MSVENAHGYIFSLIGYFLDYLWTRKLLNITAQPFVNNLEKIVESNYPNGSNLSYPKLLQSDNGGDFSQAL